MTTMKAVLTYHTLADDGSVLSVPPALFAEQMRALHETGIRVVPLTELAGQVASALDGRHQVAITFDDGFRSVYEHAFPVLQRYGFPATVFVVADYCGKTNAWPGQPAFIKPGPLLDWGQIREMSRGGVSFGSHTRTHPDLRALSRREVDAELAESRKLIEDAIGLAVETFAYPYGLYNRQIRDAARVHYRVACSDVLGYLTTSSDPLALERLDTFYLRAPRLFRGLATPGVRAYLALRRRLRTVRGLLRSTRQAYAPRAVDGDVTRP
jgi:peptidoglycan/xylan/chitin deacetylase (PgdA/CDA1 family)